MNKLSRFIGWCLAAAVLTFGLNAAIADGIIPAPGGLTLPFSKTSSSGSSLFSITNSGSGSAVSFSGWAQISASGPSGNEALILNSNGASDAIGPLQLVPQLPIVGANNAGDLYYNSTTNSLTVAIGSSTFRRVPVGFGPTAMTSGVLSMVVESGSVGCVGADVGTGIACTCAISGTTLTLSCTAGGSALASGMYY